MVLEVPQASKRLMDANQYDSWMRRKPRPPASPNPPYSDNRASERILPGMKPRNEETRLDRILKPYRGRSYEGPTEPENV